MICAVADAAAVVVVAVFLSSHLIFAPTDCINDTVSVFLLPPLIWLTDSVVEKLFSSSSF